MMKNIYIHIGTEKTGTSTIQKFFNVNREFFLKKGYLYPKSPGMENHRKLAAYCIDTLDDYIISLYR